MSDQKEIRRYYDFSHLLRPAPKLSVSELQYYYGIIGHDKSRKLIVDCFVDAVVISDMQSYQRLGPSAKQFNQTDDLIEKAKIKCQKATHDQLNMMMLDQFMNSPDCGKIFNYIIYHEIDMSRRQTFNEPLRRNA